MSNIDSDEEPDVDVTSLTDAFQALSNNAKGKKRRNLDKVIRLSTIKTCFNEYKEETTNRSNFSFSSKSFECRKYLLYSLFLKVTKFLVHSSYKMRICFS